MRAFLLLLVVCGAFASTEAAKGADRIERLQRIGLRTVARAAGDGICSRIADALLAREKIDVRNVTAAEGILIVQRADPTLFPKRVASFTELYKSLAAGAPCTDDDALVLAYRKEADGSALRILKTVLRADNWCSLQKSDLICGGVIFGPGSLNVDFTRGSIRSGLEQLKSFGLRPFITSRARLSAENEQIFNQDPDSPLLPIDLFARYTFEVEPRQEELWMLILNSLPYVENATRHPLTLGAVDASRIISDIEDINRRPRLPLASASIGTPNAQDRSLIFLKEWFAKKGGIVTIVQRDDNRLRIRVDHLRGEVIRRERFWEYLKLNLILIESDKQKRFFLMNDGFYAGGMGSNVPPDASFRSMEIDYYSNLTEYTEALATQMLDSLKGTQP